MINGADRRPRLEHIKVTLKGSCLTARAVGRPPARKTPATTNPLPQPNTIMPPRRELAERIGSRITATLMAQPQQEAVDHLAASFKQIAADVTSLGAEVA